MLGDYSGFEAPKKTAPFPQGRADDRHTVCVTLRFKELPLLFQTRSAGGGDTGIASPPTKLAIPSEDISSGRGTDVPAANALTPLILPLSF